MNFLRQSRQHLEDTGWNYWQHLAHSIKQSSRLIVIAVKSVIHGVLPWLYPSAGPVGVYNIYREIKKMHHVQKIFRKVEEKDD